MTNDLKTHVDAWEHSVRSLKDLVSPLTEGRWSSPTECPGWSVRDIVSHIIGIELELLGDPRPIHTLPRDLVHVHDEFGRYAEIPVDVRRCHTSPEMTGELEYVILRRRRMLDEADLAPEDEVRGMMGRSVTYRFLLAQRVFDVWAHEQDVRRAIGVPGNLDSPAALITRDFLLAALPRVVAKDAKAPAGASVVFDVSGPVEFMRTITVGEDGRARLDGRVPLGPLVALSTDWETFVRLMCGRVPTHRADVKIEGDPDLGHRILDSMAVTP
ncbi:maleylpyruvate isomerase family mycothiol-dependent enzyme [Streptomyces sp. SID3343]|uniref:maleylpyruvate isomerase family mycothiol-dependent enzyme n=1 Tax=Streptomyces sp. SID3343 TaxID=2690260 RepID=UPI00136CB28F|nr:maleylpyruvate isomerase family mycothiol-dependent enzyme [Streptomyces sp. SID3343]